VSLPRRPTPEDYVIIWEGAADRILSPTYAFDDLLGWWSARDFIEAAKVADELRESWLRRLSLADGAMWRKTKPDVDQMLSLIINRRGYDGWWWDRVPVSGGVYESLVELRDGG